MNKHCHNTLIIFLLVIFYIAGLPTARAQSVSNAGTEFWSVFPTHVPNEPTQLANNSIFITSSQASSGTVSVGTFSQRFTVQPNTVVEVQIPRINAYINDYEEDTVLINRAIHILVDAGQPKVVVYSHIFAGARSAASLILPKEALSQKYFSMNYQEYDREGQNFIVIAATEANTQVHIMRGTTELVPGGVTLKNVNDVYEYASGTDLTGTTVMVDTVTSGCKTFAMFSGNSTVGIPTSTCYGGVVSSYDPLFQQCYPIESWGVHYGFVPFSTVSPNYTVPVRTAGQYVRALAEADNTVVTINGATVATLNAGQYYTTPTPLTTASYITGSKPISVAQYAVTEACSDTPTPRTATGIPLGDPDMVLLNPIEYNIKNITVYSSTRENIQEEYINVLMKTASAPSFQINNAAPTGNFVPMANLPGYSYLQLDVTKLNTGGTKSFNLSADDGFNAIAYGFGAVESYSYSAGTNLASFQTVNAVNSTTGLSVDSACVNDNFFFKLVLPYVSPQLSWKMDTTEAPIVQNNPTATIDTTNGITSYIYTLPKTPAYNNVGLHKYTILAQYPASYAGCSTGQQEIDGSFYVVALPVTSFTTTPEACHNIIDFKDKSTNQTGSIKQWMWDFGDPNNVNESNTSASQNPTHAYADSGTYYVKLTVTSSVGCQSFMIDTLKITMHETLGFSATSPDCSKRLVTFTDTSHTTDFVVATRKWDFGDGGTTSTSALTTTHTYLKAGTYNVKLLLISNTGCQSDTLTRPFTVNPSPIADFHIPGVCTGDTSAYFFDTSVMSDSSKVSFNYNWFFGDPNAASPVDNISTLQNPTHYYSKQGIYTATLTVTTPSGCVDSLSKTFTINGGPPTAGFNIANGSKICSGQPVIVNNTATLGQLPGIITRIKYYFDAVNQPTTSVIIDTPKAGVPYIYTYPVFRRQPDSIVYTIAQVAYSGQTCMDSITHTIIITAVPQVQFNTINNVCLLDNPFQLTQGTEVTGISGSGTYSGDGISAGGIFSPATAGVGTHTITYKFTSTNGCIDSAKQTITVIQNPGVVTEKTAYVLLGNSIVLKPAYTGSNLTYTWTPATSLNNANVPNPVATPTDNITYTISISDDICTDQDTLHVVVLKPPIIPNTFTPNGDGINDVWSITHLNDYPGATVQIFNRYGQQLYYSVGYGNPWDGRYSGKDVPVGTYYYKIDPKNGEPVFAGSVTVIR